MRGSCLALVLFAGGFRFAGAQTPTGTISGHVRDSSDAVVATVAKLTNQPIRYLIDTSAEKPLSKELPADLNLSRMADARVRGDKNPGRGLYIVQFAGPIKDAY